MVLYKRKPVDFLPVSQTLLDSADPRRKSTSQRTSLGRGAEEDPPCWEIKETGELFGSYDEYLARLDFYHSKVFTCEVTGRSALDFFEALDSEINGSKEIQDAFPEGLRHPVLKEVNHRTEQRLEQLVNLVHDKFKDEFFPGERVQVTRSVGEALDGKIREKSIFAGGIPRYTINLIDTDGLAMHDIQVEAESIRRDRRSFNKQLLRTFLKDSLSKELWHGSPWCVKPHLAQIFGLSTQVPEHLRWSVVAERRKQHASQKRALQQQLQHAKTSMHVITDFRHYPGSKKNGQVPHMPSRPGQMQPVWSSKPGGKSKSKAAKAPKAINGVNGQHVVQFEKQLEKLDKNLRISHYAPLANGVLKPVIITPEGVMSYPNGTVFQHVAEPVHSPKREQEASPPPLIRYPIEDLEVPFSSDRSSRPKLQDFTDLEIAGSLYDTDCPTGKYLPTSVAALLEVWNTLNVHNEVFVLDSFTFDDFAQAMRYSNPEFSCELLAEAHCSVLKLFVNESGKLMIDMPKLEEEGEDEDEEDSEEAESEDSESEEPPEPQPLKRSTRLSLRKDEVVAPAKERSPTPNPYANRGEEYHAENPWQERCKDRNFAHDMWQGALAGFLYHLSLSPTQKERCDRILCKLLPLDEEPTDETIIENYKILDVNLRVSAIEIITKRTIGALAIREHLDRMLAEMTDLRKKRLDEQRIRKELAEDLQALNTQRATLMAEIEEKKTPEEKAREIEAAAQANAEDDDTSMQDVQSVNGNVSDSDSAHETHRMLRKRKRSEILSKSKAKPKIAKVKLSKEQLALAKLEDEIVKKKEAIKAREDVVDDLTNDLRETDCQRTRCLGKDRFCNRYWWYERNGMPYGGVPTSSTAEYGYANARIWVQGPYADDLTGMFDLSKQQNDLYKAMHGVTIKERREKDEGSTMLADSDHYGYIDSLEELDKLIEWLDDRGHREKALKKEFQLWREVMGDCMGKLEKHMRDEEDKQLDEAESGKPVLRLSTRTKNYADLSATGWQCLKWQNTMVLDFQHQKHSETFKRKAATRGIAQLRKVSEKAAVEKTAEKKAPEKKAAAAASNAAATAAAAAAAAERKSSSSHKKAAAAAEPKRKTEPAIPTKRVSGRFVKATPAVVIEVPKRSGRSTRLSR